MAECSDSAEGTDSPVRLPEMTILPSLQLCGTILQHRKGEWTLAIHNTWDHRYHIPHYTVFHRFQGHFFLYVGIEVHNIYMYSVDPIKNSYRHLVQMLLVL